MVFGFSRPSKGVNMIPFSNLEKLQLVFSIPSEKENVVGRKDVGKLSGRVITKEDNNSLAEMFKKATDCISNKIASTKNFYDAKILERGLGLLVKLDKEADSLYSDFREKGLLESKLEHLETSYKNYKNALKVKYTELNDRLSSLHFKTLSEGDVLSKDPLSVADKHKILKHLDSFQINRCLKELQRKYLEYDRTGGLLNDAFDALSKDWKDDSSMNAFSKSILGEEQYNKVRSFVKDPAVLAKKLGLKEPKKIFAAHMFLRAAIKVRPEKNSVKRLQKIMQRYLKMMRSTRMEGAEISKKNLILMEESSRVGARKLDSNASNVDLILSNAYVEVPEVFNGNYLTLNEEKDYLEKSKEIITSMITRLAETEDTKHVIDAIAMLIRKEKMNILFSGECKSVGDLHPDIDNIGPGVYILHHTIYLRSVFNTKREAAKGTPGTFVHESEHMLFNRLVHNGCSPVKSGSLLEAELKKAIKKDIDHREIIIPDNLNDSQQSVWNMLVKYLENNEGYFPTGSFSYECATSEDWQTMMIECIVRIMQERAIGVSREDIESIAPNLCDFYYRYSKPLLERYAKGDSPEDILEEFEKELLG